MVDVDEFNRLVKRGLTPDVVIKVMAGALEEEFEVTRRARCREADAWGENTSNRDAILTPVWDYDPTRFYLAFDGELPSTLTGTDLCVIDADVTEVASHLQYGSDRSEDPWAEKFKGKTSRVAYHWANKWPLTPPFIAPAGDQIVIGGGMHRFHLAKHYSTLRMPFLVRNSDVSTVLQILKSAKKLDTE